MMAITRGVTCSRLRKNNLGMQNFATSHVWLNRKTRLQDAQKGRAARPQRAKRRGVRFGTLNL